MGDLFGCVRCKRVCIASQEVLLIAGWNFNTDDRIVFPLPEMCRSVTLGILIFLDTGPIIIIFPKMLQVVSLRHLVSLGRAMTISSILRKMSDMLRTIDVSEREMFLTTVASAASFAPCTFASRGSSLT